MFGWFRRERNQQPVVNNPLRNSLFSTHVDVDPRRAVSREIKLPLPTPMQGETVGMDANDYPDGLKAQYGAAYGQVPDAQFMWFAGQGFIGYQMCAILAQHWMIDKACTMPAKDAVRNGYAISVNSGENISLSILDDIRDFDEEFGINGKLIEFIRFGRMFGIRVAKFVVESDDPDYYKKPFNLDGVKPNSYRGIAQIDPYWITPQLTSGNANQPGAIHFYEPDFWYVSGELIHRSHLVIYTTGTVPDVLKPSYYYGGVSVPQRIYERVYASERTANEAPQLAMTKRVTTFKTDASEAIADQSKFDEKMSWWIQTRDNYGVKVMGIDDELQQFDLSLTDLDNVIMTQYQLVAAIAEVPGTKLLGTQPKGFNATGEFEEASYHEFLESMQTLDMTPFLKRHHMLVVKSHIMPKYNCPYFRVSVSWNELDAMTAQEQANVNLIKAQTDEVLISTGAIDAGEARKRIVSDNDSGYNGIPAELPPMPDMPEPLDPSGQEGGEVGKPPLDPPAPTVPRANPEAGF